MRRVDSTPWPSLDDHWNRILKTNLLLLINHGMAEAAPEIERASGHGVMVAIVVLLFVVVTLDADEQREKESKETPTSVPV
jgi:hypothetical protein